VRQLAWRVPGNRGTRVRPYPNANGSEWVQLRQFGGGAKQVLRKMVGEESVKLAYGNESAPKKHGKASVTISYNKAAKEFQVTIIVEP